MTNKDNELIAEFMKNEAVNSPHIRKPEYDDDWHEIMLVVRKIDKLYSEAFPTNEKFIEMIMTKQRNIIDEHYMDVIALPLATPIEEVHKNIVKFINWYNDKQIQK